MIWALIIGLVVGALAKLFMPGKDPGGILITMLIGVAGSVVANFIGTRTNVYAEGDSAGILASVLGAMLTLAVYRMLKAKPA
ncbi:MAG: GlsB/YeaQ/YmgE family stress response membrane protein [Bdellovibrionales bacterium]|jgi:uncharacterized membrane protein YeaQ/YmgE (transglycosylase-associated protein family)|nr:GlsB/YeaQ/YmgE family stress response membrane protein [Bdellovibrionales bacterium]